MRPLLFCRDGVLRLKDAVVDRSEGRAWPVILPLEALEARVPGTFLSHLDTAVEFEEGLDVREALLNLAPWTREVSAIVRCRFDAFLGEASRPLAADRHEGLDRLAFAHVTELRPEPAYAREADWSVETMFKRIPGSRMSEAMPSERLITDRLDLAGGWQAFALAAGAGPEFAWETIEAGVGVGMSPLDRWHHLKLVAFRTGWILDATGGSEFLTDRHGVLAGHGLVRRAASSGCPALPVNAPEPTLGGFMLDAFVGEVCRFGTPDRRDRELQGIEDQVAECDADEARREAYKGEGGLVDPDRLAAREAEIEAEIAEERRLKTEERSRRPFSEEDLATIALARELAAEGDFGVRLPKGLPTL